MKDMFYEYDHHLNRKEYPWLKPQEKPDLLDNTRNLIIVQNVKGDKLGVRAKINSEFTLYFNLDGHVDDYDLDAFIHAVNPSAVLEIYNSRHELILTKEIDEIFDDCISVTLKSSDEGPLKSGIYSIRLLLSYAEGATPYILYSEHDGFLSIL